MGISDIKQYAAFYSMISCLLASAFPKASVILVVGALLGEACPMRTVVADLDMQTYGCRKARPLPGLDGRHGEATGLGA